MQEMLNTKKFGDIAFRDKDFKTAIEYYSKVNSIVLFIEIFQHDHNRKPQMRRKLRIINLQRVRNL